MPSKNNKSELSEMNDNNETGERVVRTRRRKYYPSRLGGVCVNAMTGQRYPIAQGSFEEMRLYKVVDATAFCDKNGFYRENNAPVNRDPNILYYDHPEEYMRHMKVKLKQSRINLWRINQKRMFPDGGDFDKDAYEMIRKEKYEMPRINDKDEVSSEDEW